MNQVCVCCSPRALPCQSFPTALLAWPPRAFSRVVRRKGNKLLFAEQTADQRRALSVAHVNFAVVRAV